MSVLMVQANKCDQCGHVWLADNPKRCSKCKSMKWNPSFVEQAIEKGREIGAVAVRINDTEYQIPEAVKAVRKHQEIMSSGVYARPAHSVDCKCLMCKPPK